MKKILTLTIALILLAVSVYAQGETCTYSGPHTELINKHIQRNGDDGGITVQCSQEQILTKECGYCGNRIKGCNIVEGAIGIWDTIWSSCQGQGYCNPNEQIPDILLEDTHRTSSCQNNQAEYAKTWQQKECGSACSYTNVKEVNEHVSWQCNTGYCTATCSSSTNEACGRCGTSTCTNCKETCSGEGVCTPGTKRVNTECSGGCEIREDVCGSNCGWIVGTCSVPNTVDEACNEDKEIGTTRVYGYCGTQICKKRCDYSAEKGRAIYYWEDSKPEYTGNDKCLSGQQIEKLKETNRETCEGALVKYADVYQNKLCPNTCKLNEGTWAGNEILRNERKVAVLGKCNYQCNNDERKYSGSDTGECQMGIQECQNNKWVAIQNEIGSSSEVCNDNLDNNCNGETDENCVNVVKEEKKVGECDYEGKVTNFKSYYTLYKTNQYYIEIDFNNNKVVDADDQTCLLKIVQYSCKNLCADVNKDSIFDVNDNSEILKSQGSLIGDANYNPNYDFDGDGYISILKDYPDYKCMWDQDKDRDGYIAQGFDCGTAYKYDCNDNDANINPGAAEISDAIDNNCNGQVDEGVAKAKWELISFYKLPADKSLQSVFGNKLNSIKIIETGSHADKKEYPGALTEIEFGKSYLIKSNIDTFPQNGNDPIFPIIIHLKKNVKVNNENYINYVGYPFDFEQNIEDVFASIKGKIELVKDGSGKVWWPRFNTNQIGTLKPGKGYMIAVSEDVDFTFDKLKKATVKKATVNIATNKPVVVSTCCYLTWGLRCSDNYQRGNAECNTNSNSHLFGGVNAVDGNEVTRWASNWNINPASTSDPAWLYVDLLDSYPVTKIKLIVTRQHTYDIQYSNDASSWTTITSGNHNDEKTFDIPSISARYWKVSVTYSADRGQAHINEFEIY